MKKNTRNVAVFLGAVMVGLTLFTLEVVAQNAQRTQSAKATQAAKATQSAKATQAVKTAQSEKKDENGCILSDGYMYSVVLAECIRPSEKGVALNPVEDGKTAKAFVVRNPKEKAAEIFLPGQKKGKVLGMDVGSQVPTWKIADFVLTNEPKKGWTLSQGEKVLYTSKAQ